MPTRSVNLTDEQEQEAKLAVLRTAIDAGDSGGIAEGDAFPRVREAFHLSMPR